MEFYVGSEKMVAFTNHFGSFDFRRADCSFEWIGFGTFHLYIILTEITCLIQTKRRYERLDFYRNLVLLENFVRLA